MRRLSFRGITPWFVAMTMLLMAVGKTYGQEIHIVSPNALADTDGDFGAETPRSSFRVQWLYPASDFDFIPDGGAFIIGHAIRADGSENMDLPNTFADSVFSLSTTSVNSLNENFSVNVGSDETVVFSGSTSISYPVSGPPRGPHPFGANIEYQTPFFYDPSLGNLLLEQTSTSGNDAEDARKDWQTLDYDAFLAGEPGDLTGTLVRRVIVTQFTIIPEPAALILVLLCAGGAGATCRRTR